MSHDLLNKEREFHKLNEELQLKTCDVMKEVNSIIHTCINNDFFNNTNQSHLCSAMKHTKMIYPENVTSKIDKQSKKLPIRVPTISSVGDADNMEISLKEKNSLGNNIINLLKSKIDMLHKELQVMQLEHNKKCEYFKELEMENKKLEETKIKLYNQLGSLNDTIAKQESINSDTLSKYQALSNENIALKKDLDSLKREIKMLSQQSTNYDMKLNRSLENNEKLRNALKCSQVEEKELRTQIRKLQEDKRLVTKNLEKQRSELMQAFKKEMLLIDNLRKQNMYLISNGQIRLTEEDFMKLLELKPQEL